jgi:predicted nuclease with TOPRIM domain
MNEQVERLQAVLLAQREQIKEMERENRRLSNLKYTLEKKINNLERGQNVDSSMTIEIPDGIVLIPEDIH